MKHVEVTLSVAQARDLMDVILEDFELVAFAIDEAQGDVFSGEASETRVTIIIKREVLGEHHEYLFNKGAMKW